MEKSNYTLGELIFDIGCLLKKYEETMIENNSTAKLLKTKQVLDAYPILTQYGLEQAVRENKIPVIKRGKLNYYDSNDIENYIKKCSMGSLSIFYFIILSSSFSSMLGFSTATNLSGNFIPMDILAGIQLILSSAQMSIWLLQ